MMYVLIGIVIFIVIVAFMTIGVYNNFIRLRTLAREGWSGIDVQLKRRHDLIPNLVATVKGITSHESGVFEKVARLRSQAMQAQTVEEKSIAEGDLSRALKSLFAVSESYPEIKANQNFLALQQQLSEIENQLQLARRYYNAVVRDYNTAVQTFPGSLIAGIFHFQQKEFFEIATSSERDAPNVSF